ncbi:unnamed protein product [Nippostrongylus brasiliensis]|uniref:Peptidase A2 domain-containing protein n=1 Tax=Nippostrongylus brasiliensis TaxID=27835 RepID=A0A0N4YAV7_NIPBR|nr:unnamed protein product [Nippostrongylus brasiliensis]
MGAQRTDYRLREAETAAVSISVPGTPSLRRDASTPARVVGLLIAIVEEKMAETLEGKRFEEEDLLRSPESDDSDEEMEHDGQTTDKRVETIRKRVEAMGHKDTTATVRDRDTTANTVLSGVVDIEAISPRVLRAYAEQRLRQESRNAIAAGHSGKHNECFKRFVRAFNTKYPSTHWPESSRLQLFEGFLRKNASTIFETLPDEAVALLDTGSEISIIPVRLLKRAGYSGIDLDHYVERIDTPQISIRDASGNQMKIFDTINVAITLGGQLEFISCCVAQGLDDIVVLGTNALGCFGFKLVRSLPQDTKLAGTDEGTIPEVDEAPHSASIKERVYVPPGKMCTLTLTGMYGLEEALLWSSHPLISHGVCRASAEGEAEVPVLNNTNEPIIFHEKDQVGEWRNDSWISPKHIGPGSDMLDLEKPQSQKNNYQRIDELIRFGVDANYVSSA